MKKSKPEEDTKKVSQSETVKRALSALYKNGTIRPEDVVNAAKNPLHPLHRYFDWNDATAAQKWRLDQARELIRSVNIKVTINKETVLVPYYIRSPEADIREQGYKAIDEISENDRRAALNLELSRVESLLVRVREIAAFFDLEKEIIGITHKVRALRKVVGLEVNA